MEDPIYIMCMEKSMLKILLFSLKKKMGLATRVSKLQIFHFW